MKRPHMRLPVNYPHSWHGERCFARGTCTRRFMPDGNGQILSSYSSFLSSRRHRPNPHPRRRCPHSRVVPSTMVRQKITYYKMLTQSGRQRSQRRCESPRHDARPALRATFNWIKRKDKLQPTKKVASRRMRCQ